MGGGGGGAGGGDPVHDPATLEEWKQSGSVGAVPGTVRAKADRFAQMEDKNWAAIQLQQTQLARRAVQAAGARRSPAGSATLSAPLVDEGEDGEEEAGE